MARQRFFEESKEVKEAKPSFPSWPPLKVRYLLSHFKLPEQFQEAKKILKNIELDESQVPTWDKLIKIDEKASPEERARQSRILFELQAYGAMMLSADDLARENINPLIKLADSLMREQSLMLFEDNPDLTEVGNEFNRAYLRFLISMGLYSLYEVIQFPLHEMFKEKSHAEVLRFLITSREACLTEDLLIKCLAASFWEENLSPVSQQLKYILFTVHDNKAISALDYLYLISWLGHPTMTIRQAMPAQLAIGLYYRIMIEHLSFRDYFRQFKFRFLPVNDPFIKNSFDKSYGMIFRFNEGRLSFDENNKVIFFHRNMIQTYYLKDYNPHNEMFELRSSQENLRSPLMRRERRRLLPDNKKGVKKVPEFKKGDRIGILKIDANSAIPFQYDTPYSKEQAIPLLDGDAKKSVNDAIGFIDVFEVKDPIPDSINLNKFLDQLSYSKDIDTFKFRLQPIKIDSYQDPNTNEECRVYRQLKYVERVLDPAFLDFRMTLRNYQPSPLKNISSENILFATMQTCFCLCFDVDDFNELQMHRTVKNENRTGRIDRP